MKSYLARTVTFAAGLAAAAVFAVSPGVASAQVELGLSAGGSAAKADIDFGASPDQPQNVKPGKFIACAWKWIGVGVPKDILPTVIMISCRKYL